MTVIASRQQAARNAKARTRNEPGTCQLVTRGYYGAPSAGDRDRDGDYDAVDGWASEPTSARHNGVRPSVEGLPMAWSGGRKGYGHRAVSILLADGTLGVRTTDVPTGVTTSVPYGWIEKNWGLHYLGYSDTITGWDIPDDSKPTGPVKESRYTKVARAHRLVEKSLIRLEAAGKGNGPRAKSLRKVLKHLPER